MDFKVNQICMTRDGREVRVEAIGLDGVTVRFEGGASQPMQWRVLPSGRAHQGGAVSPNDIVSAGGARTRAADDVTPQGRDIGEGWTGVTRDGRRVHVVGKFNLQDTQGRSWIWRDERGNDFQTTPDGRALANGHVGNDLITMGPPAGASGVREVPEAVRLTLRALLAAGAITPDQHQNALASFLV